MVEIKYSERVVLGSALGGLLGAMLKTDGATAMGACIGTMIGMAVATDTFEKKFERSAEPDQVYVIGDTPSDINCAKPHNAISVSVGAAKYLVIELEQLEPDLLFKDLVDRESVLEVIG